MLDLKEFLRLPPDTGFADSAIDHIGSIPVFYAASKFKYFLNETVAKTFAVGRTPAPQFTMHFQPMIVSILLL